MNPDFDVIVVGGGLAGLTAGEQRVDAAIEDESVSVRRLRAASRLVGLEDHDPCTALRGGRTGGQAGQSPADHDDIEVPTHADRPPADIGAASMTSNAVRPNCRARPAVSQ